MKRRKYTSAWNLPTITPATPQMVAIVHILGNTAYLANGYYDTIGRAWRHEQSGEPVVEMEMWTHFPIDVKDLPK